MAPGRYDPYPSIGRPFKLGDVDDRYIDDLHLRLFHVLERNIAVLESANHADPYVEIGKKLDVIEKFLKVRRLLHQPRRAKQKKRRRSGNAKAVIPDAPSRSVGHRKSGRVPGPTTTSR